MVRQHIDDSPTGQISHFVVNRPTARPSASALDTYGAPLAPPLDTYGAPLAPPLTNESKDNDLSGVIIAKSNPTVIGIKAPKSSDSRPTYFNYVPPLDDTKPKVKFRSLN